VVPDIHLLLAALKNGSKNALLEAFESLTPGQPADYEPQLTIVRAMQNMTPKIVELLAPKLTLDFLILATNERSPGFQKTFASRLVHDEIIRRAEVNSDFLDSITHPEVHAEIGAMVMRQTFDEHREAGRAAGVERTSARDGVV
jgi:hypothetical protein